METSAVFTLFTEMVTNAIAWMGNVVTFIIGQPAILIPLMLFFIAGGAISLVLRVWRG